ncbi:UDP-glucose 4-epimerase family protein [Vibrio tapetis]|uniref:UDP-glucose 4-epimerase n=1 Tax=Vibrio tapetis subsp. tapetis TaxID=1671868 RepID=A0A2N8ZGA6_9VIBR|nr:UDP-glucose 4-epimerase [Vibrio tapetis subsp. tapetis]
MINKGCLITGANGFLGKQLVQSLGNKYSLVKSAVRVCDENITLSENVQEVGSINGSTNWQSALTGVDVIIHTAARVHVMSDESSDSLAEYRDVNTLGTLNLARQAIDSGVKRFIFISTIKVNGESTLLGAPYTSTDIPAAEDFYGQSKAEAEEKLLELASKSDLEVVIIRSPLIYGPEVKANFASLLNLVNRGVPLPFGCITSNKRSLVYVNNLVDLVITCIEHPQASNQIFLVSDDHDVSTSEMVRQMAKSLGKPQWQLPVPKCCYNLMGNICGKKDIIDRLLGSLQVDISHTKEVLGWRPPYSFEDGFNDTANEFLKSRKK